MTAETLEGSPDVVVEDDGIGGADARNGSGLIGLKDRVEALGGHLEIRSEPGHGTCLHADIPLGRRQRWAGYPRRCLFGVWYAVAGCGWVIAPWAIRIRSCMGR